MATAGDSARVTCSICMESYKGRRPKLLPCFHTFCLPCLTALEENAKLTQMPEDLGTASLSPYDKDAEKDTGTVTLTICCPTCRKDISVPSGGVASFQANFYVDDGTDAETSISSKPVLCDLCDDSKEADHRCSSCQNSVCSGCVRVHNKICQSEIKAAKQELHSTIAALMDKANGQVEVLDAALTKLAEKEKHLDQEKRAIDDTINTLYCTALRYLADARDGAFSSLRDAAQTERDRLQAEMTAAHNLKTKLSAAVLRRATSWEDLQSALLSKSDLQQFEQMLETKEQTSFFELQRDPQVGCKMQDACRAFMGIAVSVKQLHADAAFEETSENLSFPQAETSGAKQMVNKPSTIPEEWKARLDELKTQLERKVQAVQDENRSLRHDLMSSQEKNAKFFSDFAALRDKNSIMCLDVAVGQTEREKLFQELDALRSENAKLQEKHPDLCKEITSLKSQLSACSSSQVSFHAVLSADVTTTSERILYLRDVFLNIGGGYNNKTGIFTAPVTGVYMFMATSSPNKPASEHEARLDVVLENGVIGYLCASGTESASCHTAVKVQAGEKVWLRTYDQRCRFAGGWWTSFTGVLITPEV
ncbi:hypothetical protein BaRGS_00039557 [Batillaria attramentaria]|uniref:Uncharacterized protein n=1 Tax=Batillaria attramentaria TaxID=370345 RepID=A0ABD0J2V8_9CAEN